MPQENSKPANGCGCLVLLMCIGVGVLTAIARPSYLNSVNKAKQSQGRQYVSSLNKAQQAKFAENGAFSDYIPDLGLDMETGKKRYKYSIMPTKTAVFHYALAKEGMLKSYVGGVFVVPAKEVDVNAAKDEMTTTSILCEADNPGTIEPAKPIYQNGKVICGKGTKELYSESKSIKQVKQTEAKQYIGFMNKAQRAKFAKNGAFSTSVDTLGLGIKTETTNYKYSLRTTQTASFHYAVAKDKALESYIGGVFLVPGKKLDKNADRNAMTTVSILCETNGDRHRPLIRFKPTGEPAEPIYQNGKVICGKGTTDVNK